MCKNVHRWTIIKVGERLRTTRLKRDKKGTASYRGECTKCALNLVWCGTHATTRTNRTATHRTSTPSTAHWQCSTAPTSTSIHRGNHPTPDTRRWWHHRNASVRHWWWWRPTGTHDRYSVRSWRSRHLMWWEQRPPL